MKKIFLIVLLFNFSGSLFCFYGYKKCFIWNFDEETNCGSLTLSLIYKKKGRWTTIEEIANCGFLALSISYKKKGGWNIFREIEELFDKKDIIKVATLKYCGKGIKNLSNVEIKKSKDLKEKEKIIVDSLYVEGVFVEGFIGKGSEEGCEAKLLEEFLSYVFFRTKNESVCLKRTSEEMGYFYVDENEKKRSLYNRLGFEDMGWGADHFIKGDEEGSEAIRPYVWMRCTRDKFLKIKENQNKLTEIEIDWFNHSLNFGCVYL
jgi:hypothetical protein